MKKKVLALAMALVLAVGLAACGDGKGGEEKGEAFVYVPEYLPMPESGEDGGRSNIQIVQLVGNTLYYLVSIYDMEKYTNTYQLYTLDISKEEPEPAGTVIPLGQNRSPMRTVVDKDGNVYMALNEYPETGNEEQPFDYENQSYRLMKCQPDGTVVYDMDITSLLNASEYAYVQHMEVDNDGNVYVSDGEKNLWAFGPDGNQLFALPLDTWISSFGRSRDGGVYLVRYGASGMELVQIDPSAKALGKVYAGLPQNLNSNFSQGVEKDIMLVGQNNLYDYDLETQTAEKVLNFIDCDLDSNNVRYVSAMEDGRVFLYYSDWEKGEEELILLTKKNASEVPQKQVLTLGCMYLDPGVKSAVVNFNKTNDKYRISIRDYSESGASSSENAYNDMITQMNNDILTGNGTDLISLENVNINQLAAKGVLEDLNPYLDGSTGLKREELVPTVLEAYTENGVLTGIPSSFFISTLMSGQSLVGSEMGWTLDEMMAVLDTMPEDAQILEYASKGTILQMCVMYNMDEYIDWSTGECRFDTEDFIKVLEFANRFPGEYTYDEDRPSMPELVEAGKLLLVDQSLSDVGSYQIMRTIWGEPVTCIGYPSATSNGSAVIGQSAIGINAKSEYKDAAWEFLENYLKQTASENRYAWGFPILQAELDKMLEESMKADYVLDENGEPLLDENGEKVQNSHGGYSWGNNSVSYDIYAATQEEVDAVRAVIENTKQRVNYDTQMTNIINEEAEPFFKGQKNAQEAATIIQSRIQVYVNESR